MTKDEARKIILLEEEGDIGEVMDFIMQDLGGDTDQTEEEIKRSFEDLIGCSLDKFIRKE